MVSSPAAFPVIGWSPIPISSAPFSVRFAHAKAPWLHGHCPASSLLRASPTPRPLKRTLFLRCVPCPGFSRSQRPGSPLLPNPTFPARCPSLPRRTPTLLLNVSSHRITGFNISGRLAVLFCVTRPSRVRDFSLRLAGLLRAASTRRLPAALCASLHAGRSVGMVNTFQFTSWVGGCGLHQMDADSGAKGFSLFRRRRNSSSLSGRETSLVNSDLSINEFISSPTGC